MFINVNIFNTIKIYSQHFYRHFAQYLYNIQFSFIPPHSQKCIAGPNFGIKKKLGDNKWMIKKDLIKPQSYKR